MPTGIWSSRLRSGSAHCDLELAVEVRQCPLGSGARGGGPAVPTGIWTARRRRRVRRRRRRRTALIKSTVTTLTWQVGKNDTKRCRPQKNFTKTMCTYMDRCRCAVVIWLWHKFFRSWGKLCATRWGKIIGCSVSYPRTRMFKNVLQ